LLIHDGCILLSCRPNTEGSVKRSEYVYSCAYAVPMHHQHGVTTVMNQKVTFVPSGETFGSSGPVPGAAVPIGALRSCPFCLMR
jgi:hypothetical protein